MRFLDLPKLVKVQYIVDEAEIHIITECYAEPIDSFSAWQPYLINSPKGQTVEAMINNNKQNHTTKEGAFLEENEKELSGKLLEFVDDVDFNLTDEERRQYEVFKMKRELDPFAPACHVETFSPHTDYIKKWIANFK